MKLLVFAVAALTALGLAAAFAQVREGMPCNVRYVLQHVLRCRQLAQLGKEDQTECMSRSLSVCTGCTSEEQAAACAKLVDERLAPLGAEAFRGYEPLSPAEIERTLEAMEKEQQNNAQDSTTDAPEAGGESQSK